MVSRVFLIPSSLSREEALILDLLECCLILGHIIRKTAGEKSILKAVNTFLFLLTHSSSPIQHEWIYGFETGRGKGKEHLYKKSQKIIKMILPEKMSLRVIVFKKKTWAKEWVKAGMMIKSSRAKFPSSTLIEKKKKKIEYNHV